MLQHPELVLLAGMALTILAAGAAVVAWWDNRAVEAERLERTATVMRGQAGGEGVTRALAPLAKLAAAGSGDASLLQRRLTQAGIRGERAVTFFLVIKLLSAVLAPIAVVAANVMLPEDKQLPVPLAFSACIFAFLTPNLWLRGRTKNRQQALENALPDTMDLLVTCVEAGLSLDAALQRVALETQLAWPLLSKELRMTVMELRTGVSRGDAFRNLADRTGVEELKSLAATLSQAEMFGSSIAAGLRARAEWMRTRRTQRAEQRAATVAVKMTIPLVLCILPALMAVVMGPAVLRIAIHLMPSLGGGP